MISTSEHALFSERALTSSSLQVNHVTYPDNAKTSRARLIHPQLMRLRNLYTRGVVMLALANSVAKKKVPSPPGTSLIRLWNENTENFPGSFRWRVTDVVCKRMLYAPWKGVHMQCLIIRSVLRMSTTISGPEPFRVLWELQLQQSYQCLDCLDQCPWSKIQDVWHTEE